MGWGRPCRPVWLRGVVGGLFDSIACWLLDKQMSAPPKRPRDPELQYLAEVRLAALRYARDVIGEETQRLSSLAGRNR